MKMHLNWADCYVNHLSHGPESCKLLGPQILWGPPARSSFLHTLPLHRRSPSLATPPLPPQLRRGREAATHPPPPSPRFLLLPCPLLPRVLGFVDHLAPRVHSCCSRGVTEVREGVNAAGLPFSCETSVGISPYSSLPSPIGVVFPAGDVLLTIFGLTG